MRSAANSNKSIMSLSRWLLVCAMLLLSACSGHSRKPDFNGVWQMARADAVVRPEWDESNYTAEAQRRAEYYRDHFAKYGDEPARFCYHPGMPWLMLTYARDYPYEIYQTDKRIDVAFEAMDLWRVIHFDMTTFPENFPPSRMGLSLARWEGKELVIETRNMIATNETAAPVHRSAAARVQERWRLLDDAEFGQVIEITYELDDPVLYKQPAKGRQLLKRAPKGTVLGGYNCPEASWDDFVARRKTEVDAAQGH